MRVGISFSGSTTTAAGGVVYGLDVAIQNIVESWCRYGVTDQLLCRAENAEAFAQFSALARHAGTSLPVSQLDARQPAELFAATDVIFQPDPLLARLAWQRLQAPARVVPLCGVVHTLATERVLQSVADLALAPTHDCDALICPSRAIAASVQELWASWAEYIDWRLERKFIAPLHTPVIPLGVDVAHFAARTTAQQRALQRAVMDVADDEVVLLFVGRLSFATKAHPIALLLAAEEAAQQLAGQQKLRLVFYGYFEPALMEKPFMALVRQLCRTIRVDFIANQDARMPQAPWAGADIFLSLVDNIQESFGLTPLEAMASRLPVIASDWDGYRDTVRHGQDGVLIPTYMPPLAHGAVIAQQAFNGSSNYGETLCSSAQSTAVDIPQTVAAIIQLATNPDLRHRMGESAQNRATENYDWPVIIRRYQELWAAQIASAQSLGSLPVPPNWQAAAPAAPNPWQLFKSFPQQHLNGSTNLVINAASLSVNQLVENPMNYFMPQLLLTPAHMHDLAQQFAGGQNIDAVLATYPPEHHVAAWRSLGWLIKFGVLHVA